MSGALRLLFWCRLLQAQRDIGHFQHSLAVRRPAGTVFPGAFTVRALQRIARRYPKLVFKALRIRFVPGLFAHEIPVRDELKTFGHYQAIRFSCLAGPWCGILRRLVTSKSGSFAIVASAK